MARLVDEEEDSLAERLQRCSEKIRITCTTCGKSRLIEKGCKQKWCPVCQRIIAAKRSAKFALAVGLMQWPLFITLTVPHDNDDPLHQLRRLRRGFGKLRRHKLWAGKVTGGVAGLEINSRSGAFHPHLHAAIDCRWLAHFTRPPQRGDSKSTIKAKCLAASDELGLAWARVLGVTSLSADWCGVCFKVKRCDPEGIQREILKYCVKGSDLANWPGKVGPIIRALGSTRLVTSFGSLYGKCRATDGTKSEPCQCGACGGNEWFLELPETSREKVDRERAFQRCH